MAVSGAGLMNKWLVRAETRSKTNSGSDEDPTHTGEIWTVRLTLVSDFYTVRMM